MILLYDICSLQGKDGRTLIIFGDEHGDEVASKKCELCINLIDGDERSDEGASKKWEFYLVYWYI